MVEEVKDVILREKEKSLHMSRVPKELKEEFIQFAKDEFCDDRGMAFKFVWEMFKIGRVFLENFNMKLDSILENTSQEYFQPIKEEEGKEEKKVKLLNGKELNRIKKEVKE